MMQHYLESSQSIDWQQPEVLSKAKWLASDSKDKQQISKACFNFERDEIKHSCDYKLTPSLVEHPMYLNRVLATVTPKVISWPRC